jgi:hypothetical protein
MFATNRNSPLGQFPMPLRILSQQLQFQKRGLELDT